MQENSLALLVNLPLVLTRRDGDLVRIVGKKRDRDGSGPYEGWLAIDEMSGRDDTVFREEHLAPLPPLSPLAAKVYRVLSKGELLGESHAMIHHIKAHHFELPLLFLSTVQYIAALLPNAPLDRLNALRHAAEEAGFAVCGPLHACVRRPPLPEEGAALPPPIVSVESRIEALFLPSDESVLPYIIQLPRRIDYLHAISEALNATTACPYALFNGQGGGKKGGLRAVPPLVYVGVNDTPPSSVNRLASSLAGVTLHDVRLSNLLHHHLSEDER